MTPKTEVKFAGPYKPQGESSVIGDLWFNTQTHEILVYEGRDTWVRLKIENTHDKIWLPITEWSPIFKIEIAPTPEPDLTNDTYGSF